MSNFKTRVLAMIAMFGFFTNPVRSETPGLTSEPKAFTGGNQRQYIASYTSLGQQPNPVSSRDSYADAATDLGYNTGDHSHVHTHDHTHSQPSMYHYKAQPMPMTYGTSYGHESHEGTFPKK